jgi:hypothetical protein
MLMGDALLQTSAQQHVSASRCTACIQQIEQQ